MQLRKIDFWFKVILAIIFIIWFINGVRFKPKYRPGEEYKDD